MEFTFFVAFLLPLTSVNHPIFICKNAVKCIYLMYENAEFVFCMEIFLKYELKIALTLLCLFVQWATMLTLVRGNHWQSAVVLCGKPSCTRTVTLVLCAICICDAGLCGLA